MTKQQLNIGFVPLTDCVTIAAAQERGIFLANGLEVKLKRFVSWAAMRDALGTGADCFLVYKCGYEFFISRFN